MDFGFSSDSFNSAMTTSLSVLENKYTAVFIAISMVLYCSLATSDLPRSTAVLLKNPLLKFGAVFGIAYMSTKNPTLALLATIGLVLSMMALNKYETRDMVENEVEKVKNGDLMPEYELEEEAELEAEAELEEEADKMPVGNDACPFPAGVCHYNNQNNHPDNYNHYNYNNDTYDFSKSQADVAGENVGPIGVQSGFTKTTMPL